MELDQPRHDRGFGWITPFVDAGVGNSINPATSVSIRVGGARVGRPPRTITIPTQPYTTIGKLAHVDAGIDVDVSDALSFSVLAYDTIPWGNQTALSRFVPLTKQSTQFSPSSQRNQNNISRSTKGQRFFEVNAVTQSPASLTRDNGFGASLGIPWWTPKTGH